MANEIDKMINNLDKPVRSNPDEFIQVKMKSDTPEVSRTVEEIYEPEPKLTPRQRQREAAFLLVFSLGFIREQNKEERFKNFVSHMDSLPEDLSYTKELYFGVYDRLLELDSLIERYSEGWHISRIARPDLAVLRLSIYEAAYTDTPRKVAVNEAVELTKRYCADKSGRFVNGIMKNILKMLEAKDAKAGGENADKS